MELGEGGRRAKLERRRLASGGGPPAQLPAGGEGVRRGSVEGKERRGDEEGGGPAKAREVRPWELLAL